MNYQKTSPSGTYASYDQQKIATNAPPAMNGQSQNQLKYVKPVVNTLAFNSPTVNINVMQIDQRSLNVRTEANSKSLVVSPAVILKDAPRGLTEQTSKQYNLLQTTFQQNHNAMHHESDGASEVQSATNSTAFSSSMGSNNLSNISNALTAPPMSATIAYKHRSEPPHDNAHSALDAFVSQLDAEEADSEHALYACNGQFELQHDSIIPQIMQNSSGECPNNGLVRRSGFGHDSILGAKQMSCGATLSASASCQEESLQTTCQQYNNRLNAKKTFVHSDATNGMQNPLIKVSNLDQTSAAGEDSYAKESSTHLSDAAGSFSSCHSPGSRMMSMREQLELAQPLMGPDFDPESHIVDWSDDSSDEEEEDSMYRTDEEILAELMQGDQRMQLGGGGGMIPLRRTVAAIYMPIRVNCLYG